MCFCLCNWALYSTLHNSTSTRLWRNKDKDQPCPGAHGSLLGDSKKPTTTTPHTALTFLLCLLFVNICFLGTILSSREYSNKQDRHQSLHFSRDDKINTYQCIHNIISDGNKYYAKNKSDIVNILDLELADMFISVHCVIMCYSTPILYIYSLNTILYNKKFCS